MENHNHTPEPHSQTEKENKNPTTLVVETNPEIIKFYKRVLEGSPSKTSTVILNSPEELEKYLAKGEGPYKIITSLGHNTETARKVSETLQSHGLLTKTPVTIISGDSDQDFGTLFPNI